MDALDTMPMVVAEEEIKESSTVEPQRDAWQDLKGTFLLPKVPKCWWFPKSIEMRMRKWLKEQVVFDFHSFW